MAATETVRVESVGFVGVAPSAPRSFGEAARPLRERWIARDYDGMLALLVALAAAIMPTLPRLHRARVALAIATARGRVKSGETREACCNLESALGTAVIVADFERVLLVPDQREYLERSGARLAHMSLVRGAVFENDGHRVVFIDAAIPAEERNGLILAQLTGLASDVEVSQ